MSYKAPAKLNDTIESEIDNMIYRFLDVESYNNKKSLEEIVNVLKEKIFNEFTKKFPEISFGIITGDIKFNPEADCVIMTTEILRNNLFNKNVINPPIADITTKETFTKLDFQLNKAL